jgi:hypothetical protein
MWWKTKVTQPPVASAFVTAFSRSWTVVHERMLDCVRVAKMFGAGMPSAAGQPVCAGEHSPHDRLPEL